jgi:transposase, IS30 family
MSHINETQRYTIYRMIKDRKTQQEIARAIGVSQAAVSKELKRNRCSNGRYSPRMAQMFADDAKQRSRKPRKMDAGMLAFVRERMERQQWSPEQIKGSCEANGIPMVSVEWIYHFIREDRRNGGEFAKHKLITKKLGIPVFFTAPYSSWQKGTVENTNKLIRQYMPKSMNIRQLTYNKILVLQNKLNYRPRKELSFDCPAHVFYIFAT